MEDLTTLQLARRVADAVDLALRPAGGQPNRNSDDTKDAPTQAVLRVLHETDSWFCRLTDDAAGITQETMYPLFGSRGEA